MKKHLLTIFLVLFSVALFNCGGDDGEDIAIAAEGTLQANINGEQWVAKQPFANINGEYINIVAINEAGDNLAISVKGTTTGTYSTTDIVDLLPVVNAGLSPANVSINNPTFGSVGPDAPLEGKVTITELDQEAGIISGNFELTLMRFLGQDGDSVLTITDGSFNKIVLQEENMQMPGDNYFTAKVDGNTMSVETATAVLSMGRLVITGVNGAGEGVSLQLPSDITAGSYTFGSYGDTYSATYAPAATSIFSSDSGSFTITEHDTTTKWIEGTFSFEGSPYPSGTGSVTVTEGTFGVSYQ